MIPLLVALIGCNPEVPEGTLRCDATRGCPPGWSCIEQRCWSSPDRVRDTGPGPRDAGPGPDAGAPLDAGPPPDGDVSLDAGPPDSGIDFDAGMCSGGCYWGCDGTGCDGPAQIVAGEEHTCARMRSGKILCWGAGASGQLGDGAMTNSARPVTVASIARASFVAAGGLSTCAIQDGDLHCWGNNTQGQVGDSTTANRAMPVVVRELEGIASSVALGLRFTSAIDTSGRVWSWGANDFAQLGNGTPGGSRSTPAMLPTSTLRDVDALALGADHACGRSGAMVYCWGGNTEGQLGRSGISPEPAGATAVSSADTLAAGSLFNCALTAGDVWCWGRNELQQLGTEMPTPFSPGTANRVALPFDALAVVTGRAHACVLEMTGTVSCWGDNGQSALGRSGVSVGGPDLVTGGTLDAFALAAGNGHTCALVRGDRILCWGRDEEGQLGDGTADVMDRATPEPVLAPL